jgi:hypothetical protein
MAWDEWEQIKAGVAGEQPVAMRLNQVPVAPKCSEVSHTAH